MSNEQLTMSNPSPLRVRDDVDNDSLALEIENKEGDRAVAGRARAAHTSRARVGRSNSTDGYAVGFLEMKVTDPQ
jgi:hypothetical protein